MGLCTMQSIKYMYIFESYVLQSVAVLGPVIFSLSHMHLVWEAGKQFLSVQVNLLANEL